MKVLAVFNQNIYPISLNEIRKLEDKEYEEYLDALDKVEEINKKISLFYMIYINYKDFEEYIYYFLKNFDQNPIFSNKDLDEFRFQVNCRLNNFLSSTRLFLDHSDRHIKDKYGKDSEKVKRFNELKSECFDNHFAYAFFSKLRNYVQHRGLALTKFIFEDGYSQNGDYVTNLNIYFDRELLLNDFDWGSVKSRLEMQEESFLIKPLIDEVLVDFKILVNFLIEEEILNFKNTFIFLNKLIDETKLFGDVPCIILNYNHINEEKKLNFSWFPLDLLEIVGFLYE